VLGSAGGGGWGSGDEEFCPGRATEAANSSPISAKQGRGLHMRKSAREV
jgi:hypothetical protein